MDGDTQQGTPRWTPSAFSIDDIIGVTALICGLVAWLGAGLLLLADLRWVPRAVMLEGATLVVAVICWLSAACGGLVAEIGWKSRAGRLAVVISFLLPLSVFGLVLLVGSGWLE